MPTIPDSNFRPFRPKPRVPAPNDTFRPFPSGNVSKPTDVIRKFRDRVIPKPTEKFRPGPKPTTNIPAPSEKFTPLDPPKDPAIAKYLAGDTVYQDQEAQLRRAYAEYVNKQNLDRNNYNINYGFQTRNLDQNRSRQSDDLENDFASRGLLKSGIFANSNSDLQGQFNDQAAQMAAAKAQYESGLVAALTGFQNDQRTALTSARQEAIARRAAKLNLGV